MGFCAIFNSNGSVTATVFDFRGYDTLGEAIVLFTAICGVATVLRVEKKVKEEK